MRRTLALATALGFGLTACGTTVSQTSSSGLVDSGGRLQPELSLGEPLADPAVTLAPGSPTDGSISADTGAGVGAAPAGAAGATSVSQAGNGAGTGAGMAQRPPARANVDYSKPATGTSVDVGIMYIADLGAAGARFGGNGEDQTGQRDYMKAAVEWMNAHGGLGGHKINLLYYGAEIAGSKSYDQSLAEMCSMMTEDHKVVAAVIANITVNNNMAQCMEKAKGLYVTDGGYLKTTADWARLSYTVSPAENNAELLGRELAKQTIVKGAAKRGQTVGLVVYDAPGFRAAEREYTKVAAANGIKTKPYRISYANSTPELSNSIAAVQSAVLAFQSEGVKTVVSLSSAGMMGFFLTNADQQKYYPRYVLSSNDSPAAAPAAEKNNQMKDAIAVGTLPTMDVDLLKQPQLFTDSTFSTCNTINKQFPAARANITNYGIAHRVCQALLLIQTAAKGHGGTDITGTTLRDGLRKVGAGIPTGSTYRSFFAPGKQWAPSHYRSMRYDEAQNQFVFDSGDLPFP